MLSKMELIEPAYYDCNTGDYIILKKTVQAQKEELCIFNKLPLKVKEEIFSYLTTEEKKIYRQVSKTWARIIDKSLSFSIPPLSDDTLPWIVNCRQKIEKLSIQDFSGPPPYNMIFLQAESVKEVYIFYSHDAAISYENLEWLFKQCVDLTRIEVKTLPVKPQPQQKSKKQKPLQQKSYLTTFFLNLLAIFVLYVIQLTTRSWSYLRVPRFRQKVL